MDTDEMLDRRLRAAAAKFPVPATVPDLPERAKGARVAAVAAAAGGLVVAAVVVLAAILTRSSGPRPAAAPAPIAGSRFVLTEVTGPSGTLAIPASAGTRMDLRTDGTVLIVDGPNALSGTYTVSGKRLELHHISTTFAAYAGDDPARLLAIAALDHLALTGEPTVASDIVSADATHLVIRAGAYRLTFERSGPAGTRRPEIPVSASGPSG